MVLNTVCYKIFNATHKSLMFSRTKWSKSTFGPCGFQWKRYFIFAKMSLALIFWSKMFQPKFHSDPNVVPNCLLPKYLFLSKRADPNINSPIVILSQMSSTVFSQKVFAVKEKINYLFHLFHLEDVLQ